VAEMFAEAGVVACCPGEGVLDAVSVAEVAVLAVFVGWAGEGTLVAVGV